MRRLGNCPLPPSTSVFRLCGAVAHFIFGIHFLSLVTSSISVVFSSVLCRQVLLMLGVLLAHHLLFLVEVRASTADRSPSSKAPN